MNITKKIINQIWFPKNLLLEVINYLLDLKKVVLGYFIRLPYYVTNLRISKVLAGPNTLGFKGGVWNPGAIEYNNEILLLAKGHYVSWWKAKGKLKKFYLKGDPVLLILNKENNLLQDTIALNTIVGLPESSKSGDMRMFATNKNVLVNHTLAYLQEHGDFMNQIKVSSALSEFDIEQKKISFIGEPILDFEVGSVEKNWMYLFSKEKLYLLYSFHPYRILILEDENSLKFKTILHTIFEGVLKDPGDFGTMVSFSTNPIDYNEQYWLLIIHQIEHRISGRCYYHWAVLIDKETLLPVKISSKPLFSGMGARGRTPGVRYISSVVKNGDEILFFAGEGDIYTTIIKKKIKDIEAMLLKIE